MSKKPKVIVIRAAGTNCDKETVFAFKKAGAEVDLVHVNQLISGQKKLDDYSILAIPGGFTYGDDIAAGKVLANELKFKLGVKLKGFIRAGKLIIGICNGFQVLVKAGLLPGGNGFSQEATLTINDSAKFEDRWVYLRNQKTKTKSQKCVWTKSLPEVIYLPVAHAEGKFVVKDNNILERLKKNNQIVFRYCDKEGKLADYPWNPNGSIENIAGICDETGRVFGLMPHPERHIFHKHQPHWTRLKKKEKHPDGVNIFKNGVEYAKRNL